MKQSFKFVAAIAMVLFFTACNKNQSDITSSNTKKETPQECYDKWYESARKSAIEEELANGNKGPYAESDLVPMGSRIIAQEDCGVKNE